jgi:8-oxo-dGTP diphosphatase
MSDTVALQIADTFQSEQTVPSAKTKENSRPRLGCAVLVCDGDKLLLGVRAKEPFRGKWVIPGGGVKYMESYRDTAKREIFEEVGIDIDFERVLDLYEIVNPPDEHRVIIYCLAKYLRGQVTPSSDLSDACFLDRRQIRKLIENGEVTPTVAKVLSDTNWA